MSNQRVASRYAKSIMELSLEKGRLEEVHTDFLRLTALAESNHELSVVLRNPVVNSDKKLNVLKALFANKVEPLTMTFFEIVSGKNREEILLDVAKEFENQYNLHKSIQVAEVTTTFPIDDNLRKEFAEVVKEISGKQSVQLVEKINPDLIGGYILTVNDRQIDESLSSKLRILKTQFTQNHYESKI
ncbi:ATP synthase F1 subunit delta [Algoriphagus aquimarinus]|uniref:ATP synthase subunit delta n=1 Tax=Algoriphagus aquimarinus TaxID=237018 RepID=A0A1I0WTQ5_9BACT|nr:ATP synthase F1 subunit delta [Algoriphagus aquimarinus]SFA91530.1 ATP synthase F1 subcomplex delta subunit [Algoriphagus aquimarinus]|tara:strand:- start:62420 stop:62980 length:561 start_codon:yes stop_codon:yes gene_type:complete